MVSSAIVKKYSFYLSKFRSAETLLSIIRKHIASDSIIHTDKWCGYDTLRYENSYTHRTVNHSTHFVDPQTGVHTQNIERLWRDLRAGIPRYGTRDYCFTNYLAKFLFKRYTILMNVLMLFRYYELDVSIE